jgi:hypothetical protein
MSEELEMDLDAALLQPLSFEAKDLAHVDGHRSRGGMNEAHSIDFSVKALHKIKGNSGGKRKGFSPLAKLRRPNTETRTTLEEDFQNWSDNPLTAEEKRAYLSARLSTPLSPETKKKVWDLKNSIGSENFKEIEKWHSERKLQKTRQKTTGFDEST